jgi:elongator complex protein 1
MPSGSLVTGFQLRPIASGGISREIILWERNGLRHGEFVIPGDRQIIVKSLEYSLDTTLLALHCVDVNTSEETIMVLIRSNWKWFCKQIVNLSQPLASFKWMFNKKHQLLTVQVDGRVDFIEYQLTYNTSSSNFNHEHSQDLAYTAFVEHKTINLTPLGKFMMPPPMSEKQITLPN